MVIAGLQKLTLLDFPGKTACILFTYGCNFRCPYCHNAPLVVPNTAPGTISEAEVLAFLKKRSAILDGVVITGGEPLLHRDLSNLMKQIKDLGYCVKLDTNGYFPEELRRIVEAGLADYVAMDVKNSPELYGRTAGLEAFNLSRVEESRDFLMSGTVPYEFRTTVVKGLHTEASLVSAAQWIAGAKAYYLQQFKDSGALIQSAGLSAYTEQEMKRFAAAVKRYVPSTELRGI